MITALQSVLYVCQGHKTFLNRGSEANVDSRNVGQVLD